MLTCCPQCRSWFRVRAEHLSVAGGQVTCGECDAVFNALASLIEEAPETAPVPVADRADVASALVDPPSFDAAADAGAAQAEAAPEPASAPAPAPTPAPELEPEPPGEPEPGPDVDVGAEFADLAQTTESDRSLDMSEPPFDGHPPHSLSAAEHAILFTAPGGGDDDDGIEDTVPEARAMVDALYGEPLPAQARPRRIWSVLAALGALALLAQLAWLEQARVEAWLPASRPLFATLCAHLDCRPAAPTAAVRLVARDVREHPQYRDALLVNATLVNEGATPEPYPTIELRLHDAGGRVLGARRFAPAEYLDQSIVIADGMPPAQPVYIVMELGGDAAAAASFEFTFL